MGNFGYMFLYFLLYFVIFYSHLLSQLLKKNTVFYAKTLVGRNEFSWSIFSGLFTGNKGYSNMVLEIRGVLEDQTFSEHILFPAITTGTDFAQPGQT